MQETFLLDENVLVLAFANGLGDSNLDAQITIFSIARNGHKICLSKEIRRRYWRKLKTVESSPSNPGIVKVFAQLIADSTRCVIIEPYHGRLPEEIPPDDEEFVRVAISRRPIFITVDEKLRVKLEETNLIKERRLRIVNLEDGRDLATLTDC